MITRSGLRAAWLVSGVLCAGLSVPTEAASLTLPTTPSGTPLVRSMPAVGASLSTQSMIVPVAAVSKATPSGSIKKVVVIKPTVRK